MARIVYGSVCTGIASEDVAWKHMGWSPAWHSEINPFCCEFLCHKFHNVPNLGDMRGIIGNQKATAIDLLVGGTPCQSFSSVHNGHGGDNIRCGMDDERGQLSIEFIRIAECLQPRWVVWENVPAVLTSNKGNDFQHIKECFIQSGYGIAYRLLDARQFGIPQSRVRLFVVGCRGDCRPAIAALLGRLPDGSHRKQTGQVEEGRMARIDGWSGDETPKRGIDVSPTLRSSQGGEGAGVILGHRKLRKFTTREMERLQGFPDDYTTGYYKGRQSSDKMRQRAIGNSFPPPILRWIGERIDWLEELQLRPHCTGTWIV